MKSHYEVVVIGGGVVGCSVLYHLTKKGLTDCALFERNVLTCGSTWHAAGGFHTLNGDPNVAKLQEYTINLYKEIEDLSGLSCGIHLTGGVMLVSSEERWQWLKSAHAKNRYLGVETELISVDEAARLFPLMDKRCFYGAMWHPLEGHLDPSGTTHAYASAARKNGAEIILKTMVRGLRRRVGGGWDVETDSGMVCADHVVNAGGLWAREVGRMVGIELPILAMAHQYILTESMPEVVAHHRDTGKEIVHAVDFDGEMYLRQEGDGMLLGTYEKNGKAWSEYETPWDFSMALLGDDLDQISSNLERGFRHYPAFAKTGIRKVINGPFTFAPDGNPLIGPVRGVPNFWVACGVMAGFSQGGGVGLALSNWLVEGDPGFDIWGMDVARYGDWATMGYTNAKVRENYENRFSIAFPNEERPAGRPLRTTPLYDVLKGRGGVFGSSYGLEQALWFAPAGMFADGEAVEETVTFKRSNAFAPVGRECRGVRERVGLFEISGFAKYDVRGSNCASWLSHILANRVPRIGRIVLSPMLNESGKLIGDFTLARLDSDHFMIFGSGVAEDYHMRWFEDHYFADVSVRPLGLELCGLALAGPLSRHVLEKVVHADVSSSAFPFMSIRSMDVGSFPAFVGRISYTGELGYEIWVKPDYLRGLFALLLDAGEEFGIGLFGLHALNSLRLEKGFGSWAREFRPIYGAGEAGLLRFIDFSKNDFIGRAGALSEKESGGDRVLTSFVVAADDADVVGDEPIWRDGEVVGWCTSGGYGHYSDCSLALGYIPAGDDSGSDFEIEILGARFGATRLSHPIFDPEAKRMRG